MDKPGGPAMLQGIPGHCAEQRVNEKTTANHFMWVDNLATIVRTSHKVATHGFLLHADPSDETFKYDWERTLFSLPNRKEATQRISECPTHFYLVLAETQAILKRLTEERQVIGVQALACQKRIQIYPAKLCSLG